MLTRALLQSSSSQSTVYFVDVYSSNEGEAEYALEYAALSFSPGKENRPEVYVHTYLKPDVTLNKIRWPDVYSAIGITKERIEKDDKLPSLDDMLSSDYLKNRCIVCFDEGIEPDNAIVNSAGEFQSIKRMWEKTFCSEQANSQKALECTTLDQMCRFVGILDDNAKNTNYTPLLKKLYKMAALWEFLNNCIENPKLKKNLSLGNLQMSLIWPLPDTKKQWFNVECDSFESTTDEMINELFDGTLSDRINWFELGMYANDWEFKRNVAFSSSNLTGVNDLASFIFTRVMNFDIQLWVLCFYALYQHKTEVAKNIALAHGDFSCLNSANKEHFSYFIIDNLDIFLNPSQKKKLISSLVRQSFRARAEKSYEYLDFKKMKKIDEKNRTAQKYYFFKEARDARYIRQNSGQLLFISFDVKGRGKDREVSSDYAVNNIQSFYLQAKNVFSDIWVGSDLKVWLEFITGYSFTDIAAVPKYNDSDELKDIRKLLSEILQKEAYPYLADLYNFLQNCVNLVRQRSLEPVEKTYCFQEISILFKINPPARLGFLKKLLSFS